MSTKGNHLVHIFEVNFLQKVKLGIHVFSLSFMIKHGPKTNRKERVCWAYRKAKAGAKTENMEEQRTILKPAHTSQESRQWPLSLPSGQSDGGQFIWGQSDRGNSSAVILTSQVCLGLPKLTKLTSTPTYFIYHAWGSLLVCSMKSCEILGNPPVSADRSTPLSWKELRAAGKRFWPALCSVYTIS